MMISTSCSPVVSAKIVVLPNTQLFSAFWAYGKKY